MGEAKRKRQLIEQKQAERKEFIVTLPIRVLKGITAVLLFPFMLGFMCFAENKWAWKL